MAIIEIASGCTVSIIKKSDANALAVFANGAEKQQKALAEINTQIKKAAEKGQYSIEYEFENATVASSCKTTLMSTSLGYTVTAVKVPKADNSGLEDSTTIFQISWN